MSENGGVEDGEMVRGKVRDEYGSIPPINLDVIFVWEKGRFIWVSYQFVNYIHNTPCKAKQYTLYPPVYPIPFLHLPVQLHFLQYFILIVRFVHLHTLPHDYRGVIPP